jgi:hypothetical protein
LPFDLVGLGLARHFAKGTAAARGFRGMNLGVEGMNRE